MKKIYVIVPLIVVSYAYGIDIAVQNKTLQPISVSLLSPTKRQIDGKSVGTIDKRLQFNEAIVFQDLKPDERLLIDGKPFGLQKARESKAATYLINIKTSQWPVAEAKELMGGKPYWFDIETKPSRIIIEIRPERGGQLVLTPEMEWRLQPESEGEKEK